MRKKVSLNLCIFCVLISIGAGIGIGYGIKALQCRDLSSEISEQDELITSLNSQIEQLESEISQLIADCELLQSQYDDQSEDLAKLQNSYLILGQNYESVKTNYATLQKACENPTVEEIEKLQAKITFLESDRDWLQIQVTSLEKQLTPSPDHALTREEVFGNPKYRSVAWEGLDYSLRSTLEDIGELYESTHIYIEGETDCNDMAVDLWNMLLAENIKSVIVIGNKDMSNETFDECNHAWLYVFDANGMVIYMEPTTGEVIYGLLSDGSSNPAAIPYREGYIYEKPSDLWRDLKKMW